MFSSLKLTSLHFIAKNFYIPTPSHFTRLTKKTCINHIQTCKSMRVFKQVQAQVFTLGFHIDNDILNKTLIFCTDPVLGSLAYSERILNFTKKPHLFMYNVIIKAFAKQRSFKKVIFFFHRLKDDQLSPDNFTYPFVLKAIGCLKEFSQGIKVHGYIVKTGLEFDNYVCNSLIDMYGELGNGGNAIKLFDQMPDRDVVSWNVLISACVRCKRFQYAVDVFKRMRDDKNVKPVEASIVSALTACTALKNLELGKEIHHCVNTQLGFTVTIGNALVDMYSKCGSLDTALKVFNAVPSRNVNCWTSMVTGYVNSGDIDQARELFDRSPVKDIVLWTAMINGYVQFNRFEDAVALFREMQVAGVNPDRFTVVSLLTGCSQIGALEQGRWIHSYIDENQIVIDTVVATALIELYAKCGCIEKSIDIFESLEGKDTASWTSIICGLAMNGKTTKALVLFSEMNAKPDDITFIGVLSACSHGGLVNEGRRHFFSMEKIFGIEPKLEHYGCMIDLFGRAGLLDEAESLIENVPEGNHEIVVPLYGALLSACRMHRNAEMGERVYKRLLEIESCDSSVHILLANIYASLERWEDVKKVRREMRAIGVKKVPGCSLIEVNGTVHEFLVGDASHQDMTRVCAMLDGIVKPLLDFEENDLGTMNLALMTL